jgi:hypothetical protein
MSDLALAPPAPPDLRQISTEQLRSELGRALELTASHLTHLAAVWRELERRGEDLSRLRSGLWAYMPLIASGRLRAEMVVRYAGHTMLLRRLADLDLDTQDRLLREDSVAVVEYDGRDFVEVHKSLRHLRAAEIAQVIAGRVRSPEEQRRAALGRSRRAAPRPARAIEPAPISRAGRLAEIARALPMRSQGERLATQIPLSADERAAIESHAARAGVPLTRLIRAALIEAGLTEAPRD